MIGGLTFIPTCARLCLLQETTVLPNTTTQAVPKQLTGIAADKQVSAYGEGPPAAVVQAEAANHRCCLTLRVR